LHLKISVLIPFFLFQVWISPAGNFLNPSDTLNKKRLNLITITSGAAYGASIFALNHAWYKDYPRSSFHFFNDNDEWLQMDKGGHIYTSYIIGRGGYGLLKWAGVEEKRAILYGGTAGFFALLPIEILDGFSEKWGASWGDLIANATGSAVFVSQQLLLEEQVVKIKYSYSNSDYNKYRPNVLGKTLPEKLLKDYNAITYWLSFNPFYRNEKIPNWLNFSIGYGARGMVTGIDVNPPVIINGVELPYFQRERLYYFSMDIDLTQVKTRHKSLRMLFDATSIVKFPFPALEISSGGKIRGYPVYF
jgi:hypothetical protein